MRLTSLGCRMPGRRLVVALSVALLVAGCGGGGSSHNSNESKINEARKSEASAEQIREKLKKALQLHPYAGVDDAFTLPPGRPDVHLGESGKECSIDLIKVGRDAVQAYSSDTNVLVSPDGTAMVKVGTFLGTPKSDCLEAARQALGW